MNVETSSSFQLASNGGEPFKAVYSMLRVLSEEFEDVSRQYINKDRAKILQIMLDLSEIFLTTFCLADIEWNIMVENVNLLDRALQVLFRFMDGFTGLCCDDVEKGKKIFFIVLSTCYTLDLWIDTNPPPQEGILTPTELRDSAIKTAAAVLRNLGGSIEIGSKKEGPSWKTMRRIIDDLINVCHEMVEPPALLPEYPIVVSPFKSPHLYTYEVEDPFSGKRKDRDSSMIAIAANECDRPRFLGVAVEVLIGTFYPPVSSEWFISDLELRMQTIIRDIFDFCLYSPYHSSPEMRLRVVTNILTRLPFRSTLQLKDSFSHLPDQLLRWRLLKSSSPGWKSVDGYLTNYISSPDFTLSESDFLEVLRILPKKRKGKGKAVEHLGASKEDKDVPISEPDDFTIRYICTCIARLNVQTIKGLQSTVAGLHFGSQSAVIEAKIQERLAEEPDIEQSQSGDSSISWRVRLQDIAQRLMAPEIVDWMDDNDDSRYLQHAIDDIDSRFGQSLASASLEMRLSILDNLQALSDLLNEYKPVDFYSLSTLAACRSFCDRLLEGPDRNITTEVRIRVFKVVAGLVPFHALSPSDEILEFVIRPLAQGMKHKNRSVRMKAGAALVSIAELLVASDFNIWGTVENVFKIFYGYMDTSPLFTVKETAIVTVGKMARSQNTEIRGHALCFLVVQLRSSNLALKGTAYLQLTGCVQHFGQKSAYPLLSPHFDKLFPFLISNMCTNPTLLQEACLLLGTRRSVLITYALSFTLPGLFAECNDTILRGIKDAINVPSISQLFLKHASKILAHVFALSQQEQFNKSLQYIDETIQKDAQEMTPQQTTNLEDAMKRFLVSVLAELLAEMGDTDKAVKKQAETGVRRAELLSARFGSSGHTPTAQSGIGPYLKSYCLGLITYLSEMLQGVHGKRSVDAKRKILRGIAIMTKEIGPSVTNIAPQIMATLQTMASITELSEAAVESWRQFLVTLGPSEIGPYIGPTSAAYVSSWPTFTPAAREIAKDVLDNIVAQIGGSSHEYLDNLADLSTIPELADTSTRLRQFRGNLEPQVLLERILDRANSYNITMATQSLYELQRFMYEHRSFIQELSSGDMFDPLVGQILTTLFNSTSRDTGDADTLRLVAFECLAILGAVDPDRCIIDHEESAMIVKHNFSDEEESFSFALHLITNLLVEAFRSTSDIRYQGHLGFIIQELLKFCRFTPALVGVGRPPPPTMKVRNRWNSLPKHVMETVVPLLEGKISLDRRPNIHLKYPFYPIRSTYREWVQIWTTHLITTVSSPAAKEIFGAFIGAVKNKDVSVARAILPHLVLNVLISGSEEEAHGIRAEILLVLEDQVNPNSNSTSDKKLFSAQAVFMLLDHLNKWLRIIRQDVLNDNKDNNKRNRTVTEFEEQMLRVDSILSSIDLDLMGNAALKCKAYARSLMSFETRVRNLKEMNSNHKDLPTYYERLHEIYAHLDEPDGMEGVSTMILSPSLEHQIRHHETSGRWTSAQSCWEVRLQQDPDSLESHLGLLRCLRNLGHYDTLRTHLRGVLIRNPSWESALAGFQVEGAWVVGAWDDVEKIVNSYDSQTPPIVIARVLLAMRSKDPAGISKSLSVARAVLGAPIAAAGIQSYRRSYDDVLNLHLTHELEIICSTIPGPGLRSQPRSQRPSLAWKNRILSARLEATLPTFRSREAILSTRRAAFSLAGLNPRLTKTEIGGSWLASAKIARKAGQWQTAYSAMLQASDAQFSFIESAKLLKATGEPLRALQQLENSMRYYGLLEDSSDANMLDLTLENDEATRLKAKASALRARWMQESQRYDPGILYKAFSYPIQLDGEWESGQFYLGRFQDEAYKALSPKDRPSRGLKMNHFTVRAYARAIKSGSKFIYQTMPRLLTLWLDLGADPAVNESDGFSKINKIVAEAIKNVPTYKWYTSFPQIVSRIGHQNAEVYEVLGRLISKVIRDYPKQALWLFMSTIKSTDSTRARRGLEILDKLQNHVQLRGTRVPRIIKGMHDFTREILVVCNYEVAKNVTKLFLSRHFPRMSRFDPSELIIPLQESIIVNLPPPSSSSETSTHQPFPSDAPTFHQFLEEIQVMTTLARPRKISVRGSDGQIYTFLAKPRDDLRKDARLMDLFGIINKLLKTNSDSRRRQLRIRTYGVVTLNEECGLIQWVPNTRPVRNILTKYYTARGAPPWNVQMASYSNISEEMRASKDDVYVANLFVDNILCKYPSVFHEWFIETFPEPSAWLTRRLNYGRTCAVMCMVGFIIGLGDRHGENILMDEGSGDLIHVDFNMLFEKGKELLISEVVPFRLTHNLVDGLGVTGVEGVFRTTCEITLQLLQDNKDSLMSVLDAFIHDPLVEWEEEKRKWEKVPRINAKDKGKSGSDFKLGLAMTCLGGIERKLKGNYSRKSARNAVGLEHWSTSNLVELLIQEATNLAHLGRMYLGWTAWH